MRPKRDLQKWIKQIDGNGEKVAANRRAWAVLSHALREADRRPA